MNQKKPTDAYVPGGRPFQNDILVSGYVDRNRALDTDLVVVALHPKHDWAILEQDNDEQGAFDAIALGADHPLATRSGSGPHVDSHWLTTLQ